MEEFGEMFGIPKVRIEEVDMLGVDHSALCILNRDSSPELHPKIGGFCQKDFRRLRKHRGEIKGHVVRLGSGIDLQAHP